MSSDVDRRVTHGEVVADGIRLHYVEAGPADGPLVVALHGFPDHWYTWRRQIGPLADAGYRVVAPDMRGYNRSEKPRGVGAYRLEALASDVAALVDAFAPAGEPVGVVGHDWGGVVGWATAIRYRTIDRLVALNAPHPIEFVRNLSLEQLARSWYGLAFQLPRVPEALLRAGDFRLVRAVYREAPVRPGAFTDEDVERVVRALAREGALASALDYYRAFLRTTVREHLPGAVPFVGERPIDPGRRVETPTLVLWGERDPALAVERTEGLERYATDVGVVRFPDASHWVHADRPGRVTDSILAFLEGGRGSA